MDHSAPCICAKQPLARQRSMPFFQTLTRLFALHKERRALARLDAARLADIGLTPAEAEVESRRKIWDTPAHWRSRQT